MTSKLYSVYRAQNCESFREWLKLKNDDDKKIKMNFELNLSVVYRKPKSHEQLKSLQHNMYTTTKIFFNLVNLPVSQNFAPCASEQGQQENTRPVWWEGTQYQSFLIDRKCDH